MEEYERIENILLDSKEDFAKFFEKGNQAAGSRVRKAMLAIRLAGNDIRAKVSAIKNEGTV